MTTCQVRRLSPKARARIVAGLHRSWQPGGTHREMQRARGAGSSAETERMRDLHDAKGRLVLAGVCPALGRVEIHRSTARHDQFDVFVDGRKDCTGGPRVVAEWIRSVATTAP